MWAVPRPVPRAAPSQRICSTALRYRLTQMRIAPSTAFGAAYGRASRPQGGICNQKECEGCHTHEVRKDRAGNAPTPNQHRTVPSQLRYGSLKQSISISALLGLASCALAVLPLWKSEALPGSPPPLPPPLGAQGGRRADWNRARKSPFYWTIPIDKGWGL